MPKTPSRCHCKSDLFSKTFKKEQVELLHVAVMCVLDSVHSSLTGVGFLLKCRDSWDPCVPSHNAGELFSFGVL